MWSSEQTQCTVYLGAVKHILYREHRNYCQHFITAAEVNTLYEHLAQLGLERELRHLQR